MGTICLMLAVINDFGFSNRRVSTNHHHVNICHHVDRVNDRVDQCVLPWIQYVHLLFSCRSFFQSASLLGYCVFPLNVVSLLTCIIGSWIPPFIKLILVVLSLIWSTKCTFLLFIVAAIAFIGEMVPERKRKLALYPVSLFYLFLSWFVLII